VEWPPGQTNGVPDRLPGSVRWRGAGARVGPGTGKKPQDIAALFSGIRAQHLLGSVWFDVDQVGGVLRQDWRLEGDQAGVAAFRHGQWDKTRPPSSVALPCRRPGAASCPGDKRHVASAAVLSTPGRLPCIRTSQSGRNYIYTA
jgi:hypothetical protein